MAFNLKDELKMPRNLGQNVLTNPKTNEVPLTDSYFEAMKSEKVALNQLKVMTRSNANFGIAQNQTNVQRNSGLKRSTKYNTNSRSSRGFR